MTRHFMELLQEQQEQRRHLCVGLDLAYGRIPEHARLDKVYDTLRLYGRHIVTATMGVAGAYKPNVAFYAALGTEGLDALQWIIRFIHEEAPSIPVILDYKRGDIGNSNTGYVAEAFDEYDADAVTIHPYLGQEAMQPFLDREDKGFFVLCRTSNPGAGEFQDLLVHESGTVSTPNDLKLYEYVAKRVADHWNGNGNCGLVTGATYPAELLRVRRPGIAPYLPLLAPGYGNQGGDLEATLRAGVDPNNAGILINSSRGITFASADTDYAKAAGQAAFKLHEQIQTLLI